MSEAPKPGAPVLELIDVVRRFRQGEVTVVVLMALALSFLATLYPSWRAARLDPVEGLRYE